MALARWPLRWLRQWASINYHCKRPGKSGGEDRRPYRTDEGQVDYLPRGVALVEGDDAAGVDRSEGTNHSVQRPQEDEEEAEEERVDPVAMQGHEQDVLRWGAAAIRAMLCAVPVKPARAQSSSWVELLVVQTQRIVPGDVPAADTAVTAAAPATSAATAAASSAQMGGGGSAACITGGAKTRRSLVAELACAGAAELLGGEVARAVAKRSVEVKMETDALMMMLLPA